jgi:hypothetical protein
MALSWNDSIKLQKLWRMHTFFRIFFQHVAQLFWVQNSRGGERLSVEIMVKEDSR